MRGKEENMCRHWDGGGKRKRSGVIGIFAKTYQEKKDKPYRTSDKTCRLHYFHWLGKRTIKPCKLASYTGVSLAVQAETKLPT